MNTLAKNALPIRLKSIPSQGVRFFYRALIEPRSTDEDKKRRELIFNVIASTMLGVVLALGLSLAASQLRDPDFSGISFAAFSVFAAFFASLLALSRRGYVEIASYLFIGLYYLGATYGIYVWGADLLASALSYAVIIVMSSVLLGTRFGFAATAAVCATVIAANSLEASGAIVTDRSWMLEPIAFKDAIERAFVYGAIMVVSWLSNREIERSLKRARASEAALKAERDLLEQKVEERTKELKAAQLDKVSQLYRFAEFGRLASGIFHDLLSPLTAVSLTIEKLREDGVASEEARAHVDRAIRASRRMESFMQTVRKQLKTEGGRLTFSLAAELRDAADLLSHKARKAGVSVSIDAPRDLYAEGNPIRMFQVAVNLVSNAIDSYAGMPRGAAGKAVTVRLSETEGGARIEVADRGCGIPKDMLGAIFEPFFTTKSDHDGIGIGLSTTKQIAEKDFEGSVSVKSEAGKGSTFAIDIPAKLISHGDEAES